MKLHPHVILPCIKHNKPQAIHNNLQVTAAVQSRDLEGIINPGRLPILNIEKKVQYSIPGRIQDPRSKMPRDSWGAILDTTPGPGIQDCPPRVPGHLGSWILDSHPILNIEKKVQYSISGRIQDPRSKMPRDSWGAILDTTPGPGIQDCLPKVPGHLGSWILDSHPILNIEKKVQYSILVARRLNPLHLNTVLFKNASPLDINRVLWFRVKGLGFEKT